MNYEQLLVGITELWREKAPAISVDQLFKRIKELWNGTAHSKWIIAAMSAAFLLCRYHAWKASVFRRHGIFGPRAWPLIGTTAPMFWQGLKDHDLQLKKVYGNVVGTYFGNRPDLIVFDPEIIKTVMVKEFSKFPNRFSRELPDYPFNKMVTVLKGDHWKHVRNLITPTFSSGKLRKMQQPIEKCASHLLENMQRKADNNEIFDFRTLCSAYTMDVIASTAFNMEVDSHSDPNNLFVRMMQKVFNASVFSIRVIVILCFPFMLKHFGKAGFTIFPKEVTQFFIKAVDDAMEQRRLTPGDQTRVDFLQLMVNAEDQHLDQEDDEVSSASGTVSDVGSSDEWSRKQQGLTHEEVLAQAIMFLMAGFETTASTLSFIGYSLAANPDCQEKLIAEIDDVLQGQTHVTYDDLNKLPYLDMCVSETLRMYPPAPRINRVALEDVTIKGVCIPKGMVVVVPIMALQNDPEFWPEPDKFDPDRFLPEAKAARDPYVYMPFGMGPRNCVGMRLALMELKMAVVHILQKFQFVACEKTQIPLKLQKTRVRGTDGIKVRVKSRSPTSIESQ